MSTTRKTITVTDQQDSWIKAQIAAGQFTNDSEYIRDLIRRDQASKAEIETIRAALIEAEESGEPQPFDELMHMNCRSCGVSLEKTGRAGRPARRCEACRKKRYVSEVCLRCGKPLPKNRSKHRRFCDRTCWNSEWKAADRAARKAA